MKVLVPEKSLCCGSPYIGGHQSPGKPMTIGLRVFYQCGCSMSIKLMNGSPMDLKELDKELSQEERDRGSDGDWFHLLIKNCGEKR